MCSCESDANCPDGQKCDLETKQCVAEDWASVLLATRSDVAVATDAASFKTAMSSGKNIIAVTENLTVGSKIALGSKKLAGPKYFSDIPVCKEAKRPTLIAYDALLSSSYEENGGSIEEIEIQFDFKNQSSEHSAINGNIVIKDASIAIRKSGPISSVIQGRKLSFQGNVVLEAFPRDGGIIYLLSVFQYGQIDIYGALHLKSDYPSVGINVDASSTVSVKDTGSLTMNMTSAGSGITFRKGGSFIANGPVKLYGNYHRGIWKTSEGDAGSSITLNANGNHFESAEGIVGYGAPITINGSTTIASQEVSGRTCLAIDSSGILEINAPLTVNYPAQGNHNACGIIYNTDLLKINSTIKSTSGEGYVRAKSASVISSSGAILGVSELDISGMYVSAGAKIQIGGKSCLKASSVSANSCTIKFFYGGQSEFSMLDPFTDNCN